ncbi:MAG: STAS domain-containing protein [Acidimicrobiales bacterium]
MELEIPDIDVNGWTVVAASGEVDVATAPKLRERLVDLINGGSTQVVLDLENVDFIDSTGLGVLVGALRRARADDGDLRIACTNSRLLRIFDITGLGEVFTIESSVDEAISATSNRP